MPAPVVPATSACGPSRRRSTSSGPAARDAERRRRRARRGVPPAAHRGGGGLGQVDQVEQAHLLGQVAAGLRRRVAQRRQPAREPVRPALGDQVGDDVVDRRLPAARHAQPGRHLAADLDGGAALDRQLRGVAVEAHGGDAHRGAEVEQPRHPRHGAQPLRAVEQHHHVASGEPVARAAGDALLEPGVEQRGELGDPATYLLVVDADQGGRPRPEAVGRAAVRQPRRPGPVRARGEQGGGPPGGQVGGEHHDPHVARRVQRRHLAEQRARQRQHPRAVPGQPDDADVGEGDGDRHVVDPRVVGRGLALGAGAGLDRATRGRQDRDARRQARGTHAQVQEVVVGGAALPDALQHTGGDVQQLSGVGCARAPPQPLDHHRVVQLLVDPRLLLGVRPQRRAVLLAAAEVVAHQVAEQHQRRQQAEQQEVPGPQHQGEGHRHQQRDEHRDQRHAQRAPLRRRRGQLQRHDRHGRRDPRRPVHVHEAVAHLARGVLGARYPQPQRRGAHQHPRALGHRHRLLAEAAAVDEGAVGRPEVAHRDAVRHHRHLGVHAGRRRGRRRRAPPRRRVRAGASRVSAGAPGRCRGRPPRAARGSRRASRPAGPPPRPRARR